ncbi:MAG: hypothetical protein QF745_05480 [Planctomycetota bacterium]|jgi:predicted RNA-binding Zn-ribbon protein involved in translation (DUF1610 family)|nr:hypothetical protein [Planctomycetota bacterium]
MEEAMAESMSKGETMTESVKCANVRIEEDMILFDCPHCGLDAEVDESTLAGLWAQLPEGTFQCPESEKCGKEFVLPTLDEVSLRKTVVPPPMGEYHPDPELVNTPPKPKKIEEKPPGPPVEEVPVTEDKSADGLVEKETEVFPVAQDQPAEKAVEETPIILSGASPPKSKPAVSPPKPTTTNGQEMPMAIRTFRHSDWQGGGQDNFDEEVSRFLVGVGTGNVVSVTPISYTDGDAKLDDYGVMVVFKHEPEEAEEPVVWRD